MLELVTDLVTETGGGVTLVEIRAAYAARIGEPPRMLAPTIASLRKTEQLIIVGGAHGQSRYAPAGTPQAVAWQPLDDDQVALDALVTSCAALRRPVTTREVTATHERQVEEGGRPLRASNVNAMRVRLTALAKEQTRGGRAGRPVTVLMQKKQLPTGRTVVLWWPTALGIPVPEEIAAAMVTPAATEMAPQVTTPVKPDSEAPAPEMSAPEGTGAPADGALPDPVESSGSNVAQVLVVDGEVVTNSQAAYVRAVVRRMTEELGRPVSRTEVSWWIDRWHQERPLAAALHGPTSGNLLAMTAQSDARAGVRLKDWERRLVAVRTEWTAFGAGPIRYRMGLAQYFDDPICRFEDFATTLRVADEIDGLEALAIRAQALRTSALDDIAWARRTALATRLEALLDRVHRGYLEQRIRRTLTERARLVYDAPGLGHIQRQARALELRSDARHINALLDLMGKKAVTVRGLGELKVVGEGPLISPAELRPLLERARLLKRATPKQAANWLRNVRRFAAPVQKGRARFGAADDHPLALYDRVDAVFAIFVRFRAPHTRALLRSARSMLGPVLRDTQDVMTWLRMKERVDSVVRRGLLVALGALGVTVHPQHALLDPRDAGDAAAWALSAILADLDRASERIEHGRALTTGAARWVLTQALTRLRIGYPFSAIG